MSGPRLCATLSALVRAPLPKLAPWRVLARSYSAASVSDRQHDMRQIEQFPFRANWTTLEEQPLTAKSVTDILQNSIPAIRHRSLLSSSECEKLVEIVQSHPMGSYEQDLVFPPLGTIGITVYEYLGNQQAYLDSTERAYALQKRFIDEAGVDVLDRVAAALQKATGLETRVAREGNREYFAGLLRAVTNYIQVHADYAPHEPPGWQIHNVVGQISWNILLKQVIGGETIIYDRPWNGAIDNRTFKKEPPKYDYRPSVVEGRVLKVMPSIEGDLTFFNSRNFHEVKPCDMKKGSPEGVRYTLSSFVGLLPGSDGKPPSLIMWS